MSNKAHLRPHKNQRQVNPTTRVLVVILFVVLFVLSIALAASGHGAELTNLRLLRGAALAVSVLAGYWLPRGVHAYEDHREEHDHRARDYQDVEGTAEQVTNHHATMLAYSAVLAGRCHGAGAD